MVDFVGYTRPVITPSYFTANRTGRTAVPVKSNQSVYAQFKYLRGVPSNGDSYSVPLDKLRMLDTLIGRLAIIRAKSGGDSPRVNSENVDYLIESLQGEVRNLVKAAEPFTAGVFPEAGMLVDLVA